MITLARSSAPLLLAVLATQISAAASPSVGTTPTSNDSANDSTNDPTAAHESPSCVVTASLEAIVNSGTADYLRRAVAETAERNCTALLVTVDTPGGMLDATRDIVRAFLNAPRPVIAFVAPAGARAGSAGMFITLSAHIAAMAPASNIGAAHPVTSTGQDTEQAAGKDMAKKVENDTAAFARSIAEQRTRNVTWAESAVRESSSATASEAMKLGVIDLIAQDQTELLNVLNGREITLTGGTRVHLRTRGALLVPFEMTIQQRLLTQLGNPSLAYLLLMLGLLGIMVEFYNPGILFAGGLGAFALLLAAIGMNALPVNVGGVVLIVLAVVLFASEMFVLSHGLLAAFGVVCLILGSALLMDRTDPDFFADASVGISWLAAIPLAFVMSAAAMALAWQANQLRMRQPVTGSEGLVGERGATLGAVDENGGWVLIRGERWRAVSQHALTDACEIEVTQVRGLTLEVVATSQAGSPTMEPAKS